MEGSGIMQGYTYNRVGCVPWGPIYIDSARFRGSQDVPLFLVTNAVIN